MAELYIYPEALFSECAEREASRTWTCVRTRPRWEKKFATWCRGERLPYFLPTYRKTTRSHRKRRTTVNPLFPGYLFVAGEHTKQRFTRSSSVVRTLKPTSPREHAQLNAELTDLMKVIASRAPLLPELDLEAGQTIEILEGPLCGTTGTYIRRGARNCLVLKVEMLGVGSTVELLPDWRFEIKD